ncbi:hypothetical protein EWT52_26935 [Escherichia coli O25b:H4]|nr:hypothetical protein EWT52_26935 [Escherichia coli O25b:H4]
MKLTVLRGIFPDFPGCRWLPVPAPFKTGSVPLAAESAEPDARLFHKPAIAEPENALAEVNPKMPQTSLKSSYTFSYQLLSA